MQTAQQQHDAETPPDHPANLDRALNVSDRTLIAETDGALLMRLEAAWWVANDAEFALAFEEAGSYHEWVSVARAKADKCEADIANAIRKHIELTGVVPAAFCE